MAASAWVVALRMLAARRLTEMQLRERLAKREFPQAEIDTVLVRARELRVIDDVDYARAFVSTRLKAMGNRRMIGDMVKRGIDRETAIAALQSPENGATEEERLQQAAEKLRRTRPGISLPTLARGLERLGFPASAIYRFLQDEGEAFFADTGRMHNHSESAVNIGI